MSEHKWKIGDWIEHNEQRKFIYDVNDKAIHYVTYGGNTDHFYPSTLGVKHLPDCDSWDWQPPKPIEPPEGYRLLVEGEKVRLGEYTYNPNQGAWCVLHQDSLCIGKPYSKQFWLMARKIEPKVRPMTRDEFLAAWKQRGFCPLINPETDIDVVLTVAEETEFDADCVYLNNAGWCSMDELADYKFASDDSPLTVEEWHGHRRAFR